MQGFYYLLPVLITIFVSFLAIRAAAVAFMMTGLDREGREGEKVLIHVPAVIPPR